MHRLSDTHMHWNSICQLLSETLENLTQVYTKLCHINDITTSEIDWLMELQESATQRQVTRGNVELIQNEIARHKVHLCTCAYIIMHHVLQWSMECSGKYFLRCNLLLLCNDIMIIIIAHLNNQHSLLDVNVRKF